ncbi:hypothetical protein LZ30DRAFT_684838 [Colletotrichum cereale]|nr:hypothetical protein LZ30DRAFT_684838 [Colletotrichum cereale]
MRLHRSNERLSAMRPALDRLWGWTGAVASKTRLALPFSFCGLERVHRSQPTRRLPLRRPLASITPAVPWHLMASHGISSPDIIRGPAIQEGLPAVAHQVPGSDLDMASNDDMLLSAFDLTILPIFGKNMEHSHAEAPGRRQHHHRSGTYCGQ